MANFRDIKTLHKFPPIHASTHNQLNYDRHLNRRARRVVMIAPVEVGDGGVELLVGNGLLKQYQAGDRHAVGEPCLVALEQWAEGHGARSMGQG